MFAAADGVDFNTQPLDLVYYALTQTEPKATKSQIVENMANTMVAKEASIKKGKSADASL